jgi:(2S)-methylsuccinyl-CoA dehydrogenase
MSRRCARCRPGPSGWRREGAFGETERLIHQIAFGEYLWQLYGGIPMSQGEIVRPQDLGLRQDDQRVLMTPAVMTLTQRGNTQAARTRLVALMREGRANATVGRTGLDDELEMIREQFRRFSVERVEPHAHEWHLKDELIPMEIIAELRTRRLRADDPRGVRRPRALEGVDGRGVRGAVARLYRRGLARHPVRDRGGADPLRRHARAEGEVAPRPRERGDPAHRRLHRTEHRLGPRQPAHAAKRDGEDWVITGNKTWITHAARTHVMTVLARTVEGTTDYRGLSMFLAEKTPGTDATPFVDPGLSGGEIEVLGYRGMKEYTVNFDDFRVKGENLLGGEEGQGFKQLMQTFESARIQTAARAVGVAQSALDVAMRYAEDRKQFGKPLIEFPRVSGKLAMMAVEIMVARQLTYFSAWQKDHDKRCDLEAGMAKLLGARVAWAAPTTALQIHGGNGFALEYAISRILCDARILNIFEGAAEIQAQVIARRLLG